MSKRFLLVFMLLLILNLAYAKEIFLFNFNYNNDRIILNNVNTMDGYVSNIKEGEYTFYLLDDNKILNKFNFEIPQVLEIAPTVYNNGKHIELKNFNFTVPIDYTKKFSKIRIEKDNKILFEEDIEKYNLKFEEINWIFYIVLFALMIIVYLVYKIRKT